MMVATNTKKLVETPRTDAALIPDEVTWMEGIVTADFARKLERELRAAEEACIKSAADKTFIRGGDIPNTIEAARIVLLQRCETAERELTQAQARCAEVEKWLDGNTTFFDVQRDLPVEGPNIPVLAAVSRRIWYHATDDTASYPFSAVIDAALRAPR